MIFFDGEWPSWKAVHQAREAPEPFSSEEQGRTASSLRSRDGGLT